MSNPGIYFIHGGEMIPGNVAGEDPVAAPTFAAEAALSKRIWGLRIDALKRFVV